MRFNPVDATKTLQTPASPDLSERKKAEAPRERDDELLPRYDPNHANKPTQDGLRDKAGRPAGKPDPRAEPNVK